MNQNIKKQIFKEIDDYGTIEIFLDYRDYDYIENIIIDCDTFEAFYDKIYEIYEDYYHYEYEKIIKELSDKYNIKLDSEDYEELEDMVYCGLDVRLPYEEIFEHKIRVNILTNFYNDSDSSFTSNGWLRWIMHSQGYKLSDYSMLKAYGEYRFLVPVANSSFYKDPVKDNWSKKEINKYKNKFLKSLLQEINNMPIDCMRTLVFLAEISVKDYLHLKTGDYNKINLKKNVMCGLYDKWSGCGSVLEIELEKDIIIKQKNIYEVQLEGLEVKEKNYYGYKVDDVYGLIHSCWKSGVSIK